eukprot:7378036-Prymnesium_polylepis.1
MPPPPQPVSTSPRNPGSPGGSLGSSPNGTASPGTPSSAGADPTGNPAKGHWARLRKDVRAPHASSPLSAPSPSSGKPPRSPAPTGTPGKRRSDSPGAISR